MTKHFTLIGSRDTPKHICDRLEILASYFVKGGYIGRSGGADGADTCLEAVIPEVMEVYLPWADFNGREADGELYINVADEPWRVEAYKIARDLHPAWDKCSWGARKLHTRNVYQILGRDLESPSECVICYAKPSGDKGYVQGGTATAVKLAVDSEIPVFNLWYDTAFDEAMRFLNEQECSTT